MVPSAHSVAWTIKPVGLLGFWNFIGDIQEFKLVNGTWIYQTELVLENSGFGSQTVGSTVPVLGSRGQTWLYVLQGTATDEFLDTDIILPGCEVSYTW